MSLLEVVCSVWILGCCGLALIQGWTTSIQAAAKNEAVRVAADCADDAAERWLAGMDIPVTYTTSDGEVCTIEVRSIASAQPAETVIEAKCGVATQELWLAGSA